MSDFEVFSGVGTHIGHFRVLGELGRGGMGTVYVGLDETLGRRVALKVIRPDQRLDPLRKARFLREARALAKLNHPNVCLLHDFIEGDNHDCLVLELVDGVSLLQAMNDGLDLNRKLDIAERLIDVLVAVHGRGLIHRDLKPANIMISSDGAIKVLDFGLARPVEDPEVLSGGFPIVRLDEEGKRAESSDELGMTTVGTIVGTVGYMSPEVARGETATAVSDLYSVGLILHELFTGRKAIPSELPLAERHRRAMWAELEPLDGLPADLANLIGRLESLVPENRPSAIDAAAMLREIRQRPRRRRRRRVVAAVWAMLALFGVGMTIQFLRAESETRRAEEEAATAREVSEFLLGLFEHASPRVNQGREITVQELLRRGAETVDDELREQPAVRARMLHTLGTVHYHLGLYDEAEPLLDEALQLRRNVLSPGDPEMIKSLEALGLLRRVQGRYEDAAKLFDEALATVAGGAEGGSLVEANLLVCRSGIDQDRGQWEAAEPQLLRAVAILEARPDGVSEGLTDALYDLAALYRKMRRLQESERALHRCLDLDRGAFGDRSEQVAGDLSELAALASLEQRFEEAEGFARESMEIRREILGDNHPYVGHSATTLGFVLGRLDRRDEAIDVLNRALTIYRSAFGPEHPYVGDVLYSLGVIASKDGRLDDASGMLEESLRITVNSRSPEHPLAADTLQSLAAVRVEQGRFDEAEELLVRALAIRERAFGPADTIIAETLDALAVCLLGAGRTADADEANSRARAIRAGAAAAS